MSLLSDARSHYPVFRYTNATYRLIPEGLELLFTYVQAPEIEYTHRVVIAGVTANHLDIVPQHTLDALIRHLGAIELISYWKATCSPEISFEALALSPEQLTWWQNLYLQGLGEFFFVNQIDFTTPSFMKLSSTDIPVNSRQHLPTTPPAITPPELSKETAILIPVGGGKDSVVSLELLHTHIPTTLLGCLLINPTKASSDTANISGIDRLHTVKRILDPQLAITTEQTKLNGHVPISASYAWISLIVAHLYQYQVIAVSNESSSNEGSVQYLGTEINHQYSKTYAFEQALQHYCLTYIPNTPWYCSLLRPLSELQIAQVFAQYPQYHQAFRSCNKGQKSNSWCCQCPKCLFAYLILAPFIELPRLTELFGSALFENESLWPELQQLLGFVPQKPLECVGTRQECRVAVYLACQKVQAENQPLPFLLRKAQTELNQLGVFTELATEAQKLLRSWNTNHSVPEKLAELVQNATQSLNGK
ncbi:hypothetical protein KBC79_04545 [Candidatus Woesebacteria bacterium]|nr:hypothetical protein [Candidatus Woesebacteria bacterium]